MSEDPNQPYAAYPRQNAYGSAAKLKALYDGYNGLTVSFLICVVANVAINAYVVNTSGDQDFSKLLPFWPVVGLLAAGTSFVPNKKVGVGKGWPSGNAVLASVLIGLNAMLCCGVIGFLVMQSIAINEMKKYNLKTGVFGFNKKIVLEKIKQLEGQETGTSFTV
jgi:hypothetical protein